MREGLSLCHHVDRRWLRAVVVGAVLGVAACSDAATGPEDADLRLEIVTGDGQEGVTGWPLPNGLIVRVTDASGVPMAGVPVTFSVTSGSGLLDVSASNTGASGSARTSWTLGAATVRSQSVTAAISAGSVTVVFQATTLGAGEADMVVVHGVLDGLTGFALVRQGAGGELALSASLATSDTVLLIPPEDRPGLQIIAFGRGNRPLRVAPAWTGGIDTANVTLLPPVPVDIDFHIRAGDFAARKRIMEDQLSALGDIWRQEGVGTTVGQVDFFDETASGGEVDLSSAGICSGLTVPDAIQVSVVSSIDSGQFTGWGCWTGHLFLGVGTERFPNLLAHEIGHTFTLVHTATGMMFPSQPQRAVLEGEIFRAHFHQQSALSRIFASQPTALRRNCSGGISSPCLPETLDLSRTTIALAAVDGSEVGQQGVAGLAEAGASGRARSEGWPMLPPSPPANGPPVDAVGRDGRSGREP